MKLLANDLSFHEQFNSIGDFRDALLRLMSLHATARRFGSDVECNGTLLNKNPMPGVSMQQAINKLMESERRIAMRWLTGTGPFWDDERQHDQDDWLECNGDIVTDTAVGEAAFRLLRGVCCGLASLSPSNWCYTPVEVNWCRKDEGLENDQAVLENWWEPAALNDALKNKERPIETWEGLRVASTKRFKGLKFAEGCFEPLKGTPFAQGAAERFLTLLGILERFSQAYDESGERTAEGHRLYQNHFTGDNAHFSDSSETEKQTFNNELQFPHPDFPGTKLYCPWHGKVRLMNLRLHFSWPIRAGKTTYVVYAGPKITKR